MRKAILAAVVNLTHSDHDRPLLMEKLGIVLGTGVDFEAGQHFSRRNGM